MDDSASTQTAGFAPLDPETQPSWLVPNYRSSVSRSPGRAPVPLVQTLSETTGPVYGHGAVGPLDHDLTQNGVTDGAPLGERIIVTGRVLDEDDRPQPNTLIEIWQCNAAGRYIHEADQHDAPIDPNFFGGGRCVTDEQGVYRFITIKPAAYPWGNHRNAWRPAHIHLSLFGPAFVTRLVTQSYFPGDPLLRHDPIFTGTPEPYRDLLVMDYDPDVSEEGFALGYRFDLVLRGRRATPLED